MREVEWNLHSSDDKAFDRQSKGPELDTQWSQSVPFHTENIFQVFKNFIYFLKFFEMLLSVEIFIKYLCPSFFQSLLFPASSCIKKYLGIV